MSSYNYIVILMMTVKKLTTWVGEFKADEKGKGGSQQACKSSKNKIKCTYILMISGTKPTSEESKAR
jgi:hypothetical protein